MSPSRFALYVFAVIVLIAVTLRLAGASLFEGKITSWWRSPWKNSKLGGSPFSRHLLGLAIDVAPVSAADSETMAALSRIIPTSSFVQEGDHLHFQLV